MNRAKSWNRFSLVLAVLLVAGVLPAAGSPLPADWVIVAQTEDVWTMDPHVVTGAKGAAVWRHVYSGLLRRDANMRLHPDLAVSYRSVAPTVWEFALRRGVKFHNGEDFTAEAVRFTFERLTDPGRRSPYAADYRLIERVEVVNPFILRFITRQPWPELPMLIPDLLILPPKYVREKGDEWVAKNPVGTGPYRLVEWIRDEQVILRAYEGYWGGPPKARIIYFRPIPDVSTRMAALLRGEVDVIDEIPVDQIPILRRNPRVKVVAAPTTRVVYVGLNTAVRPFSDRRVRQALNYAVDVDSLVKQIKGGMATRVGTVVAPELEGYDPQVKPYTHDLARARQLLREAGYPEGFTTTFQVATADFMGVDEAEYIASQLENVGVRARLVVLEKGLHVNKLIQRTAEPMYFLSLGAVRGTLQDHFNVFIRSGGRYTFYSNPEVDRLLEQTQAMVDAVRRKELFSRVQQILREDPPAIFLYQHHAIYGVSSRLQGWTPRVDGRIHVDEAWVAR